MAQRFLSTAVRWLPVLLIAVAVVVMATTGYASDAAHGGGHGGGGHGGGGGLPQLNPATIPTQLFWLGICFVILYFLLSSVALPKVVEVVEIRESRIAHDIDRADQLRAEAENLAAQTNRELAAARLNAQTAVAAANHEVEAELKKRLAEVEAGLAARMAAAETSIFDAKMAALGRIHMAAGDLAVDVVSRIGGFQAPKAKAVEAVQTVLGEEGHS